jgi:hypothetical protein
MTASSHKVGIIELQFIFGAILVKPGLSGANVWGVTNPARVISGDL